MGKIYGSRWEIVEGLGRGGQGEVFLVRDLHNKESGQCVLKRVLNPRRHDRFIREVQACKQLSHPNVMRVLDHSALDHDPSQEKMYLVMPLAVGGNLEKRAALYKDSIDSTVQVALKLAQALQHAHERGVIHRDVKPANILFGGDDHHCILSDFGICLIRDLSRVTETGEVPGPRVFMAPELEEGGRLDVTPAADLYSLGKVIYFMLSGGEELPRERHREGRFDIFTGRGMRSELLGRLLDRLICPVGLRIGSAKDVILELTRIQQWDQQNTAALSPGASSAMERFIQQERAALSVDDHNRAVNEKQKALFAGYRQGVQTWMEKELRGIAATLTHEGISIAEFLSPEVCEGLDDLPDRIRLDIGHSSFLSREFMAALRFSIPRDPFKHQYHLLLQVFSALSISVSIGSNPRKLGDRDQSVVFIPYFFESALMQGYFNRKEYARQAGWNPISRSLIGASYTLLYKSTVSAWPSAIPEYKRILDEAVETFVGQMAKRRQTGSFSIGG